MHSENMFTSDYVRGGGAKCNTVGCVNQNKTTIRNDSDSIPYFEKTC